MYFGCSKNFEAWHIHSAYKYVLTCKSWNSNSHFKKSYENDKTITMLPIAISADKSSISSYLVVSICLFLYYNCHWKHWLYSLTGKSLLTSWTFEVRKNQLLSLRSSLRGWYISDNHLKRTIPTSLHHSLSCLNMEELWLAQSRTYLLIIICMQEFGCLVSF